MISFMCPKHITIFTLFCTKNKYNIINISIIIHINIVTWVYRNIFKYI